MPDTLNHHALRGARECVEACVTIFPLGATELHLDELVVIESTTRFGHHRRGYPVLADEDDGIERVAKASQIFALTFGELHGPIVKIAAWSRGLKPNVAILIKQSEVGWLQKSRGSMHRSFSTVRFSQS